MNSYRIQGSLLMVVLMASLMAFVSISACDTAQSLSSGPAQASSAVIGTSFPTVTTLPTRQPISFPSPTDAQLTREASDAQLAQHAAEVLTSVALSPKPAYTPGPRYIESPIPTATWALGWAPCRRPFNTYQPEFFSCWHGTLNGQLLAIDAGHEQREGNLQQGVIEVSLYDLSQQNTLSDDLYQTPLAVGAVRIVSVDGTRVTLAPWDPATPEPPPTPSTIFVFDLATRQWVNPQHADS
jgi:hypothetical protein